MLYCLFFFFKQKTAYEMRISDWSSDVCSSDLARGFRRSYGWVSLGRRLLSERIGFAALCCAQLLADAVELVGHPGHRPGGDRKRVVLGKGVSVRVDLGGRRSVKQKNKTQTDSRTIHIDCIMSYEYKLLL